MRDTSENEEAIQFEIECGNKVAVHCCMVFDVFGFENGLEVR